MKHSIITEKHVEIDTGKKLLDRCCEDHRWQTLFEYVISYKEKISGNIKLLAYLYWHIFTACKSLSRTHKNQPKPSKCYMFAYPGPICTGLEILFWSLVAVSQFSNTKALKDQDNMKEIWWPVITRYTCSARYNQQNLLVTLRTQ